MLPVASGPSVWHAAELERDRSWIAVLTSRQMKEADAALREIARRRLDIHEVTAETFPLPSWRPLLAQLRAEMVTGRGVMLVRGLPIQPYSAAEQRLLFWGIGAHLGTGVTQTKRGELICDVWDSRTAINPLERTFATTQEAPFHVDNADVVGLLCLRQAKSGGASLVSSSAAIYNRVRELRPDLLPILLDGFERDRRDEHGDGEDPIGPKVPVFTFQNGRFFSRFNPTFIGAALKRRGAAFSPQQAEAFDLVRSIAKDPAFALRMDFQPGDMQFLSNYTAVHSRTGYEDHPEPERRRHLLRLWLNLDAFDDLLPDPVMRYGQIRYGNLGLAATEWHRKEHDRVRGGVS